MTKKAEQTKNQQLLLGPSENWGHKTSHCPQIWRDRQADAENHNLPEQKPTSTNHCRNQCWGREIWTVTDELLEAQWELKTQRWPILVWGGDHFHDSYFQLPYQILWRFEKITSCFQQREGKSNLFYIFSDLSVPGPRETIYQSLTDWGFTRGYPTWRREIPNSSLL